MGRFSAQLVLVLATIFGCLQIPMVFGETLDEKIERTTEICVNQTGISEEQTDLLMDDEFEHFDEEHFTHDMRCYMHCFHKNFGIIDKDGNPIEKEFVSFMEVRFSQKKDKVMAAMEKCRKIVDPDPCEHVFKFEICMAHTIELDKWHI
ncbi:uncharacterized protein LOC131997860 [Stomoxys calcitrans]|uniref:Uncharacterized protein n=1 Tax=Stomoxys calcitrans TaxID=35570 RepID=A0A2Y9D4S0_STOCA|nr:uncharacterized protein LOC131997860 [Stomoxys calcitrans]